MPVLQKKYFLLLCLLLLGGCSHALWSPSDQKPVISRTDLLSGELLFGERAKAMMLPDDHVMRLDSEMRKYLDRYVPAHNVPQRRVRMLMDMILNAGMLNMTYDAARTYTARNAFQNSEGNCLAFSYLFVAFAQARGLKVTFQEVEIPPEWNSTRNELYTLSRHVNVKVHMKHIRDYIIDIDRINYKPHYRTWRISGDHAIALYYSNRGTDYLNERDYENAFRYLAKALKMAPKDPAIWSNLGVLYRMKEKYVYAERAYFIALEYNDRQRSVLSNLSVLYEHMGQPEKAEYYFQRAKTHQMQNPYYRYYQALEAFEGGDYKLSLSHLKTALKRRKDEQKFYRLLGDIYTKLGDMVRANNARAKAKELSEHP